MKNGLIDVEKKGFFIFVFGVLREANFMFFNGLIVGGLNFHHGFEYFDGKKKMLLKALILVSIKELLYFVYVICPRFPSPFRILWRLIVEGLRTMGIAF